MKTGYLIFFSIGLLAALCIYAVAQDETADEWYKKGRDLGRNGSYEEAASAYNRAIELEPNNATFYTAIVPTLNMLAFTTNNQSKRNESLEAIDKALEIDPKNPIAWEQKGSFLSQMERYNESLNAYDRAIENISSYRQDIHANQTEFLSYIWTSKSISLWQLMRYDESLEAVDKSVQIDPAGNYDAWAFKGELLASLGRYNESIQAFEGAAATETASSQPEIRALPWAAEGYVLMQVGRYDEADRIYQKIIGLNFTSEGADRRLANAWRGRGNALAKLGKYNESLQAFDKAIELSVENAPYAWTGKGDALRDASRYEEALQAYDESLKLYPEYADAGIARAWKGKGDVLIKTGRLDEALAAYDKAIVAYDEAIQAFDNATPIDKAVSFTFDPYPLDGEFWYDRGYALWSLDRDFEASSAFEKARSLGYRAPGHTSPTDSLSITNVTSLGVDEIIELTYTGNETQSFKNLRLISGNESIVLPNFTLEPGAKIRMHFGLGATNRTDLFLDSEMALDDVSGNLRLKDLAAGVEKFMSYWTPGLAQENTAGYWVERGNELYKNESYQEALNAYDQALKMDSQNASAWHYRGLALAGMGHGVEANQSIQKAMELIDQRLQEDSEDLEALWMRAEEMDLLGRSEEALEAYGRVAELNSSHVLEAWIRESDILAALGRYNQSVESFSRAMALIPANESESQLGFQRRSENTFIFTKAWLINGQIHRVSIGLYNISSKSFDEIEQINSGFVAALQLKGKAVDSGRHYGYIMSSLNGDIYSVNVPKTLASALPHFLTITQINPTEDDFIEVTNGPKEAVSLQNWSLEIQGSRVSLPEYSLLPGKVIRVHLGSGQKNETDLFLNSDVVLNDTVGNVSVRDGSGAKVALVTYRTRLDGSIAHQVVHYPGTDKNDIEYPGPGDQEEMVQKAAGEGPFVAERVEIGPELAHNNYSSKEGLQEGTADDWYKKGTELFEKHSWEESLQAMEEVIQIDPENSSAWLSIAKTFGILGNGSAASKAYEKTLSIADEDLLEEPQDVRAWQAKSEALIGLGRPEEAFSAQEKALEILNQSIEKNPEDGEAWWSKARILGSTGRDDEALQAYEKVIELNHMPRLADALLAKSFALAVKGEYDGFLEAFNRGIELIPDSDIVKLARSWNDAGFAFYELDQGEMALEAFSKVTELSPGDKLAWRMKADMASQLDRYNESVEAYDRSLQVDPGWPEGWYKKGKALDRMGNHEEAMNSFEKAVETSENAVQKDASDTGNWIVKGYALIKLERYNEAQEALDRALEIASPLIRVSSSEAWNGKGDVLLAQGRNEEALAAYNRSIEFNPAFGLAWNGRGLAQKALGRVFDADQSFYVARKLGYQG